MAKQSFLDQLKILLEVSISSKLFVVVIIFLLFLAYILITTNRKNAKTGKRFYFLLYAFIFIFLIVSYYSSLSQMWDYMMNHFFIVFYFPDLAVYLAAIVVTNVILWISVFRFKVDRLIRNINVSVYCILHYILALVLKTISTEKLDVFTQASVYGNKEAKALIELSSTIFFVWILFLILYKIIRTYQKRGEPQKIKKVVVTKKVKILPENIKEVRSPSYVRQPQMMKTQSVEDVVDLPYDQLFTLEDYKILSRLLREEKQKKKQEEIKLQVLEKEQQQEQEKYEQLQELYRRI